MNKLYNSKISLFQANPLPVLAAFAMLSLFKPPPFLLSQESTTAQETDLLKQKALEQVDSIEPLIEEVAIKLWEYSETALQETQSVS